MARHEKVVWSEGMFLRPAHFQQQVRYLENLVEQRTQALQPHAVGFSSLELDHALLRMGKLAIREARGVFADGTPFCIPHDDDAPPPLDIEPGDADQGVVHLALAVRRFEGAEVGFNGDDGLLRYGVREVEIADTHTPGGTPATVQLGRLNLRLVAERDRHGDVMTLGIARVIERRDDGQVVLDAGYLAPAQDCRALPPLHSMLQEVQGLLRHRAEALAARVSAAGRGGLGEIADFLLLQLANRCEALATHLIARGQVHPQEFFAFALQLAAELATFTRPDKRAGDFAPYRHHDLQGSFAPLIAELRRSLGMVLEQSAIALPLELRKYGIRVGTIPDRELLKGETSLVIAARASLPAEELRRRLPSQIKIGSVEQIRQLVNLQLPGVALRALPVAPRQLPYHAGFVYFELERGGDAWTGLAESSGIAIHVSGDYPGLELELWAARG